PGSTLYMGVLDVAATMDEVIALFRTDSTADAKAFARRFNHGTVDAVDLYTVARPSGREKVSVVWHAMATKALLKPRDGCFLECNRDVTVDGQRAWVRSYTSIDLACCPPMLESFVRMMSYGTGRLFVESKTRPGYITVSFVTHVDFCVGPKEWLMDAMGCRSFVSETVVAWRTRDLLLVDRFLREDRLSRSRFLTVQELVPQSRRQKCHTCAKPFGPLRSKANCFKCGQVLCRACTSTWHIVDHDGLRTKWRVCAPCTVRSPNSTARQCLSSTKGRVLGTVGQCLNKRGRTDESSMSSDQSDSYVVDFIMDLDPPSRRWDQGQVVLFDPAELIELD
ncbi:hypothetical protein As57867_006827, partial [Aphanomyces stellatus]